MRTLFRNERIRALCEDINIARRKLGDIAAKKLQVRLFEIYGVSRVGELRHGNPHPLKGDRAGQFAVELSKGWRLVFSSADKPRPEQGDTFVDWSAVTVICIEYIGDYHE